MSVKKELSHVDYTSAYLREVEELRARARAGELRDPLAIYAPWCKQCHICVTLCPAGVLAVGADGVPVLAKPEACTRCRICELHCPDYAITVFDKPGKGSGEEAP